MAYTALNDLSIRYVFPLIIEDEKQIIQLIIASTDILKHDIEAYELMAEVVAHERLHLQMLELASEARCLTTGDMSIPAKRRTPVRSAVKERLHVRSGAGWITRFPTNVTTESTLSRQMLRSFDRRCQCSSNEPIQSDTRATGEVRRNGGDVGDPTFITRSRVSQ